MTIDLIIFDLDGTLVDTAVDLCNAINHAIAPTQSKPVTVEETKMVVGEGITRLFEKIDISKGTGISKEEILNRFIQYYSQHLLDNTKPYPHVEETLKKLTHYKKAVVSNKREGMSRKILEGLGLSVFFDMIVGSDTIGIKKPSPEPLLYVINNLKSSNEKTVIVGDSNYDIEAGKAIGIKTIAVTYGFRPIEYLTKADFIIDSLEQLPDLLKRL
ncbi:MAG: HAD-IA family hydrolase [Thermodesulfovibrionales bacterium]|nr:HAD-IA family hydrolase [Thermodesulfovibrionales bacterium]